MTTEAELRPEIMLGRARGDHLAIRVLGRMHPGADDFWDGNWLVTPVEVVAGGFRGESGAALRAEELRGFGEGLKELNATLKGEAVLDSMEMWLTVRVAVDRLGGVVVTGSMVDQLGSENELTFKIGGLDQSDLPAVIQALDKVQTAYPVLGTP